MNTGFLFSILDVAANIMIAYGIFFLFYSTKRKERRDRVEYSTRMMKRWNDPAFFVMTSRIFNRGGYEVIGRIKHGVFRIDDIETQEITNEIISVLNFLEEMAQAIELGLADERVLRKYFQQSVVEMYKELEPFIYFVRKERRNRTLFISTEKLIGKWTFSNIDEKES